MSFSVLLSLYRGNNPQHLKEALDSVIAQTLLPGEVVLVEDGPLGQQLDHVVAAFIEASPVSVKHVKLPGNTGLANGLNEGLRHASFELVARMDTDDICAPDRFEKQVNYFREHPECAVLGGQVREFFREPGDIERYRKMPLTHEEILRYALRRCPFNHPSVMYKRTAVAEAGYYEYSQNNIDDYLLWAKILIRGRQVANLDDVVLWYRLGDNFLMRRRGVRYMIGEYTMLVKLRKIGFLSRAQFLRNLVLRAPFRLMPGFVIDFVYTKMLRHRR